MKTNLMSFAADKVRAGEAGSFSGVGTIAWVSRDASGFFPPLFFPSLQQIIYENILTSLITSVLIKD